MSVFVPLQQASRTTNEIRAINPWRTWTPAEADDSTTAQCRAKFLSAPNSLQLNSPMPSEVSISPEQPSTQQPNAERSFYQPRTAINSTAQCRAKFLSAPNSLQLNSPMPSEVYISPEQPSTPQPKTKRSLSVPNSLPPLSATKPTLVLNRLQPSNLCLSQSFQPHSHKAYHSPE